MGSQKIRKIRRIGGGSERRRTFAANAGFVGRFKQPQLSGHIDKRKRQDARSARVRPEGGWIGRRVAAVRQLDVERVLVDALEEAGPEDAINLDRGVERGGGHRIDPCTHVLIADSAVLCATSRSGLPMSREMEQREMEQREMEQ